MHEEVNTIRKKRLNEPWPQFLRSVTIDGLRGWTGQEVRFEFPVTVIAGENGSGKSTVLKVAAAAYTNPTDRELSFYPSIFFPVTAWDNVSGVTLTYKIRRGTEDSVFNLRKLTQRWRGLDKRPNRNVVLQDISRTLPLDATVGYAKLAKRGNETSTNDINAELIPYFSTILGRQYQRARMAQSSQDISRSVGVVEWNNLEFSQFHQGAGEDATLDLLSLVQDIPRHSLIIIDEVEASLHPRSQRRLIHFLLWLARTKSIQVILSTHSSYVLEELPEEARIFLNRGNAGVNVFYGVTPNFALNRMDDIDRPDLYLFTEDDEATVLVQEILRAKSIELSRIRCMAVGPSNVVETLGRLGGVNRLPIAVIGVLDADKTSTEQGVVCLPGTQAPERQVFDDILRQAINSLSNRLATASASVTDALSNASTLDNHHDWINFAARELRQSPNYLWTTMCQVWAIDCLADEDARKLIDAINHRLN